MIGRNSEGLTDEEENSATDSDLSRGGVEERAVGGSRAMAPMVSLGSGVREGETPNSRRRRTWEGESKDDGDVEDTKN